MGNAWEWCSSTPGARLIYTARTSSINVLCYKSQKEGKTPTSYPESPGFITRYGDQVNQMWSSTFSSAVQTKVGSIALDYVTGVGPQIASDSL